MEANTRGPLRGSAAAGPGGLDTAAPLAGGETSFGPTEPGGCGALAAAGPITTREAKRPRGRHGLGDASTHSGRRRSLRRGRVGIPAGASDQADPPGGDAP